MTSPQISPQGCGYPPNLQCVPFFEEFGAPGLSFSCFVSSLDPGVVIHTLDRSQVIPFHCLIITFKPLFTDLHVTGLFHPHPPLPIHPVLCLLSSGLLYHLQQRDPGEHLKCMWLQYLCVKDPSKSVAMQNSDIIPQLPSSLEESLASSSSACSLASSSSTMRLSDKKK